VCHGIALTPDEKEIWLVDTQRVGIHVFDVSG
jgi:sugar lactone lactonase YvrE